MSDLKYYAESVPFQSDIEKEQAHEYLKLWAEFFCIKNDYECLKIQIVEKNKENMPDYIKFRGDTIGLLSIKIEVTVISQKVPK